MKIKHYILSAAFVAAGAVCLTACHDDDEDITVVRPAGPTTEFVVGDEALRVKIGPENRQALPIVDGLGDYHAFSLTPEVADVVEDGGQYYVEGKKNGVAQLVASDAAGRYKTINVSVYTTEQMTLDQTTVSIEGGLGTTATARGQVTLGNGDYTISSDNRNVTGTIDAETGEYVIRALCRVDEYTATVTISDTSGLTAEIEVTVTANTQPFTQDYIDTYILGATASNVWADCKDPSDGNQPYYFRGYRDYENGAYWHNEDTGGTHLLGWHMLYYGSTDYGQLTITYPQDTPVGQQVEGGLQYRYSSSSLYDLYEYEGTVTVLEDSETRTVAIFTQLDRENERLNRGYCVVYK